MNATTSMTKLVTMLGALSLALIASSCTGRSQKNIEVGDKKKNGVPDGGLNNGDTTINTPVTVATLNEQSIRAQASAPNATLTYKFTYLSFQKSESLVFANGTAVLSFSGLPANQVGDMVLEISEGTTLKLRGIATQVILKVGQSNSVNITVAKISDPSGGNGNTTDVDINVDLNNGTPTPTPLPTATPVPTAVPTAMPTAVPTAMPTAVPTAMPTATPQPTVSPNNPLDPVTGWDGKSHLGNAKWTIVGIP